MVNTKEKNIKCGRCLNQLTYTMVDTTYNLREVRTTHRLEYAAPCVPCTDIVENWTIKCPNCGNIITVKEQRKIKI